MTLSLEDVGTGVGVGISKVVVTGVGVRVSVGVGTTVEGWAQLERMRRTRINTIK